MLARDVGGCKTTHALEEQTTDLIGGHEFVFLGGGLFVYLPLAVILTKIIEFTISFLQVILIQE